MKTAPTPNTILLHPAATSTLEENVQQTLRLHDQLVREEHALEEELAAVRARHQPAIDRLSQHLAEARARTQAWAEDCRPHFQERRSMTVAGARIGFRKRPPRLERRRASASWEAIAAKLETLAWASGYIRRPEPAPVLDKKALLADRAHLPAKHLAQAGLRIVQEETFFIEPAPVATGTRSAKAMLQAAA